jgi:hypothetical protein
MDLVEGKEYRVNINFLDDTAIEGDIVRFVRYWDKLEFANDCYLECIFFNTRTGSDVYLYDDEVDEIEKSEPLPDGMLDTDYEAES